MAGRHNLPNGTILFHSPKNPVVFMNGTVIQLQIHEKFKDSELNELLYVIIVIVFYATALMTLIITQIRRQRREGTDVDYYDEYLQRNQEVKRTCQTAVKMFMKPEKSPVPPSLNLPKEEDVAGAGSDKESDPPKPRQFQRERSPISRERSPVLESIPDEELVT